MDYAIIRSGGKQYKVSKGSTITVDKLSKEEGKEVDLNEVLLWSSDGKIVIGTPYVSDIIIRAKVLKQEKGEKIRTAKFKAKARYRKVIGFRPLLTKLQIEGIETSKKEAKVKPEAFSEQTPTKTPRKVATRVRKKT